MKTKTLTVAYYAPSVTKKAATYKVVRVQDSTDFAPGQWMNKEDVDFLSNRRDWRVTVVEPK